MRSLPFRYVSRHRRWWSDASHTGGQTWHRWEVRVTLCPRIHPAFLAEQRASMGDLWYRQVFGAESSALRSVDIMAASMQEMPPWTL
jgi:hypothetical protein